ncbi:DMSO/selenate family reductase complex B subunit [Streptomyces sp. NPDC004111]|uniref:DMSO/selenate family reductase complex B subunit n=1 Tax=Streptomyces sp. NPDC004111 TaxID=3364690 RepID=UPI003678BF23
MSKPEQLGFYFDQSLCTGCKACQIACKDKHDLPLGVNWRRVAEYAGGTWQETGDTFTPHIFTSYVSVSCNHCDNPVCVTVCPTTAMSKGPDGIVAVDESKCVGCRYCEWACPYSAPQFNEETGHMSKCDMCADHRDRGEDPACVAACPSRALDWGPIGALRARHGRTAGVEPLPDASVTRPNLVITPHRDAQRPGSGTGTVVNEREI